MDAYHRHGPGSLLDFSREERGISAYAIRFFSKANPFYLFSRIAFPPYLQLHAEAPHEVLVNSAVILQLEKHALRCPDRRPPFVYLRSFLDRNGAYDFFITGGTALRRITVPKSRAIELVIDYFRREQDYPRLDRCVNHLAAALDSSRLEIEEYISRLTECGIIAEYLVPDFNRFADFMSGIDPDYDPVISRLQQVHTAQVTMPELLQLEDQIGRFSESGMKLDSPVLYINAYSKVSTRECEAAADRLYPALQAIKPLLLAGSNFADWAYVTSAFMKDFCKNYPDSGVPYLTLLAEFCREMPSILSRYQPQTLRSREEQEVRQSWRQRLAECEGTLSDEQLRMLTASCPHELDCAEPICFNGPLDTVTGIYYPHNFFAGKGRYLSRYLLGQTGKRTRGIPQGAGPLHMQILPPFDDNHMYVAPMLPVGFGFEARYRHKFDHWIDPADIIVKLKEGQIAYYLASSNRALHFHFFGFLLGQLLRPEFQLLLVDHVDFFNDPFDRSISCAETLQYVPALYYRSVCLRREQWRFSKSFFAPLWKHADILRCTLELRERLHEAGIDFRHCYFRLLDGAVHWPKPRYLDLCNPLSVHIFRRSVRSSSVNTMVSFTRMEPSSANLFMEGQCSYVTELMIEV